MAGNFDFNVVRYNNALNNVEVYLKCRGDVEMIETANNPTQFLPLHTPLQTRIWAVICSVFSSARRQANSQYTLAKYDLISRYLAEISETERELLPRMLRIREWTRENHETIVCAVFHNVCLSLMQNWNRYNSPGFCSYLVNKVSHWLGYRENSFAHIQHHENFYIRQFMPNEGFYGEVVKARESRFIEEPARSSEFRNFLRRTRSENVLEADVAFNTMKLAQTYLSMDSLQITLYLKNIREFYSQKPGVEGFQELLALLKSVKLYFPDYQDEAYTELFAFMLDKVEAEQVSLEQIKVVIRESLIFYYDLPDAEIPSLKNDLLAVLQECARGGLDKEKIKNIAHTHLVHPGLTREQIDDKIDNPPQREEPAPADAEPSPAVARAQASFSQYGPPSAAAAVRIPEQEMRHTAAANWATRRSRQRDEEHKREMGL